MKKKILCVILIILLMFAMAMTLVGCEVTINEDGISATSDSSDSSSKKSKKDKDDEDDEDEDEEEEEEDSKKTKKDKSNSSKESDEKEKSQPAKTSASESASYDAIWESAEFKLGGVTYTLPIETSKLQKDGWNIDFDKYGYDDSFVLNKYQKSEIILVKNTKYEKAELYIYFLNTSGKTKSIKECPIGIISLDNTYAKTEANFELPGGVKSGDKLTKVESVYGKPKKDNIYVVSDDTRYEYSNDYMRFTVTTNKDKGVTGFNFTITDVEKFLASRKSNTASENKNNASTQQTSNTSVKLSTDWKSGEFALDGIAYKVGSNYKDFEKNGWFIDLAKYGYEDGYTLNKNYRTDRYTLELESKKYPKDGLSKPTEIKIGIENNSDSAKDITECQLWYIDVTNNSYKLDKAVKFELPGGIKNGATKEQVKKAYGEPTNIKEEGSYTTLSFFTYTSSDDMELVLMFDSQDNIGLKGFTYTNDGMGN